jgi:SDR family mycofactocin-dependent oxidoreductase
LPGEQPRERRRVRSTLGRCSTDAPDEEDAMRRVESKVALITGAARGQGRSHAARLAEEGASIIAVDICATPVTSTAYELACPDDLAETVRRVEDLDGRISAHVVDVRDAAALRDAVGTGIDQLGPLDIIIANAAIFAQAPVLETGDTLWREVIETNLTGVLNTVQAGLPSMVETGRGGSIVLVSSSNGFRGFPNSSAYAAAKHGVVGLVRTWANELGEHGIRVNSIHPSCVPTPMLLNEDVLKRFRPDLEHPTIDDAKPSFQTLHLLPTPWLEERDISNAVLWLASDEARFVTGVALPVDAGFTERV